jgi:formate dehydrogenase subunit delta
MDVPKLARMANQIAQAFSANGEDKAVAATADHIWKFWDPRMKAAIFGDDLASLSPIAKAAILQLKADAAAV